MTNSDKYWHRKRLNKPRTNKNDDSNTEIFTSDNRVDSKIDFPHLCRLIGDGLGLCVDYRDVLGGDFTAKGVGDIRNSNRFCLHHGRLWKGSRHSREWVENCLSHYINFTSTHHQLPNTIWNLWSSHHTVRLIFCADYIKKATRQEKMHSLVQLWMVEKN